MKQWRGKPYGQSLLYRSQAVFEMIRRSENMPRMIGYFFTRAVLFSAAYGLCPGAFAMNWQIVSSAVKTPLLLLGTIGICLPALFTFNVLLGSKLSIQQVTAALLMANYLLSLVLASLAPILLFFIISTPDKSFVLLLNVACFAVAGLFGVALLWRCMRYLTAASQAEYNPHIIRVWTLIYIFVGTQLSWLLRPYIGAKGEFALVRRIGGNFYVAVFSVLKDLLTGG